MRQTNAFRDGSSVHSKLHSNSGRNYVFCDKGMWALKRPSIVKYVVVPPAWETPPFKHTKGAAPTFWNPQKRNTTKQTEEQGVPPVQPALWKFSPQNHELRLV